MTADALDQDLDKYWIKKGETGTVKSHLDNEMDEYWKKAGQASSTQLKLPKGIVMQQQ